jgi:hypothetical protein
MDEMILYTYKEALTEYGSRSEVNSCLERGSLFYIDRNLYSTDRHVEPLAVALKRYPMSVVSGLSAFYIHGLTDHVPVKIDLATKRNATRINDPEIKQHFVANSLFEVGIITKDHDGAKVCIYNLEVMLYYLIHHDGKLPFDLFKEVMQSYRNHSGELDYRRLQRYSTIFPGGRRNFERIIKEVL